MEYKLGGEEMTQKNSEREKLEKWGEQLQQLFPEINLLARDKELFQIGAKDSEVGIRVTEDQVIFTGETFDFGGEWKDIDDRLALDMEKEILTDIYAYQDHYENLPEYLRKVQQELPDFPFGKDAISKDSYILRSDHSLER